tara:strand:- start:9457 stop:9906 length:450 start_codon:yes stop_codon:yes gene_type:complete
MCNSNLGKIKLRHVGLVVKDLEKSLYFWCDILGFNVQKKQEEKGEYIDSMMGLNNVDLITAKLADSNGNVIELLYFRNYKDNNESIKFPYSIGLTHISLTVSDIDKTIDKLNKLKMIKPNTIVYSPDKKVKVVYVRSIENLLIEFVEEL